MHTCKHVKTVRGIFSSILSSVVCNKLTVRPNEMNLRIVFINYL